MGWSLATMVALLGFARPAHAIEVACRTMDGSCTVSNDPFDSISCSCNDTGGDESSGGDMWADLTEDELMEICLAEVAFCGAGGSGSTSVGTSVGTVGTDTGGSSSVGAESSTTAPPDTDSGTTAASETGSGSGSGGSDTGVIDSTSDGASSSGGGSATGGSASDSASASATGASASDSASAGSASAGDESSSSGAGESNGSGGCSCDLDGNAPGWSVLGVFAAVALRRRRR
ncbi:MAG: hypothetical protein K1X88_17985 [Nannocystaceae bacterium]|nr:hypothetical protein [Nannocystaceae bacterium]